jgi:hypothetical protein
MSETVFPSFKCPSQFSDPTAKISFVAGRTKIERNPLVRDGRSLYVAFWIEFTKNSKPFLSKVNNFRQKYKRINIERKCFQNEIFVIFNLTV